MELNNSEVFDRFLEPISGLMKENDLARKCKTITDWDWIKMGLLRVFSAESSGRSFLEEFSFSNSLQIGVGHFFNTLNSERRKDFLEKLNNLFLKTCELLTHDNDPVKAYKELDDFEIFLGDGHYHKASIHENKVKDKKYPTQHFYAKNLRNEMMVPLALAEYGNERKKESDIRMLKKQTVETLRQNAKKGRKVLWVWDRAVQDFMQWYKWKRNGIYILSREKSSNRLQVLGTPIYDKNDPINNGVLNDEMVGTSNGESFRRVTYQCPESGTVYKFLTTLPFSIRPGLVAFLYKKRWNIEKTYNTFKHKLSEKRSWGKEVVIKKVQSNFICLAHNLALILSRKIEKESEKLGSNLYDKHHKRQECRIKKLREKSKKSNRPMSLLLEKSSSLVEIPKKFFVWLRSYLGNRCSWEKAYASLISSCAYI